MSRFAIKLKNVSKRFGKQWIFQDINLDIPLRSIMIITGSNGSGKSVLLKLIAGLYQPTLGTRIANISSLSFAPDYLPEELSLTVQEYIDTIYLMNKKSITLKEMALQIQYLGLKPYLLYKVKDCSKGTRQKINILQALVKPCDVLIFDEPFSGLDKNTKSYLANKLSELAETKTIILTNHEADVTFNQMLQTYNIETQHKEYQDIGNPLYKTIIFESQTIPTFKEGVLITLYDNRYSIQIEAAHLNKILFYLIQQNSTIIEVK
ncbi:ATP-binding cassette domain-containing protein [Staphylococcus debuckii]|uniref:ATP-binding cassette domain-containing protein n=1 Tax=Staphylococcus debuckii TaxID=2044912 RepID=UPI000F4320C8|nr:ATP-binding cassette domain-containing protein [Staphylococcus debuckii]AYU53980.1 ATP-binding cassette domain-containing protein [Staphylococcus debuckii]